MRINKVYLKIKAQTHNEATAQGSLLITKMMHHDLFTVAVDPSTTLARET